MGNLTSAEAIERACALRDQFALRAAEHDRAASFPFENFDALRDAGMLALTVRREWGGDELGIATACRVVDEIGYGEPSTALVLAMQYIHHAAPALHRTWRADMHELLSRDAVENGALINVMRAEPELGTSSRGGLPATTAERVADGWRLNGHKLFATGSPLLKWFLIWAQTGDDPVQAGWFAVPKGTPGMRIVETWDHLGMRATGSHDLLLEDAVIPDEYALELRPAKDWLPPDPYTGSWNNLVIAALYRGVARAARDWLVKYLNERTPTNLGASLATLPRHQQAVGEIESLLWTSDRAIHGLADQIEHDGYTPKLALSTATAKYVSTTSCVKAVDIAMSLVGNPGLYRSNPLERHHRDVLCSRIHVPQEDMVLLMTGKMALGVR